MDTLTEDDWDDILDDIRDQKAILLLGPELLRVGEQPLHQYVREQLMKSRVAKDIAYFYERDGIYLFGSPEGKVRAARQLKRIYREIQPNTAVLERIVPLPFSLILSLNPDSFMSEAFYAGGVQHRFHFFQHRNRQAHAEEMEKPSKNLPLIYNLFGSNRQDDSIIFDYDDVFKLFQSLVGASNLPQKILKAFRDATTFIFLGFHFDKWYTQILLKCLSDGDGFKEKLIAIHHPNFDPDIRQFIAQEFKIQFIGSESRFLEALYRRCENAHLLRKVDAKAANPNLYRLYRHVANAEIADALECLSNIAPDKEIADMVLLLQGRFAQLNHDKNQWDSRDFRVEFARILDAILKIAEELSS